MLTYVFPGQGSQVKGMGENLFSDFKTLTGIADDILGYSIKTLCVDDPHNRLSQTQYTQPALYVVSALGYLQHYETTSRKSDFLAGHSLGEYSALFAAGVFDFATGLRLVQQRGELMSQAGNGSMAAVVGLPIDDIRQILKHNGFDNIDIANLNSPLQTVISGDSAEINTAAKAFEKYNNVQYFPLRVSAAFHSRLMQDASERFRAILDGITFKPARVPVISNVHAKPYVHGQEKENLSQQITRSVRWTESVEFILNKAEMTFQELGPGQVLSNLIEAINRSRVNSATLEKADYANVH